MLPAAVSHGNSAGSWNISATRPDAVTVPAVGWSRPATRLSSVDLPQPDAPIRQVNSPGGTSSEILSSARTAERPRPNTLDTPARCTDPAAPSTADRWPVIVVVFPCLTMPSASYELICGWPAAASAWLSGPRSKMPFRLTGLSRPSETACDASVVSDDSSGLSVKVISFHAAATRLDLSALPV